MVLFVRDCQGVDGQDGHAVVRSGTVILARFNTTIALDRHGARAAMTMDDGHVRDPADATDRLESALFHIARDRRHASLVLAAALGLAACGPAASSPSPAAAPSLTAASASPTPTSATFEPPASATPSPNTTGFAFAAEDVAAYYESSGYACDAPRPSTAAAGYTVRTCQSIDEAGRTRVIGLVMDPNGGLANGFASVKGTETETILAPIDALDPLAGFLGAMLGEQDGAALLSWLASHLGDTYAETTSGPIKVATYTESEDDHSTLYVELANQAYLDAAPPETPQP
jgi:hypothetical protein